VLLWNADEAQAAIKARDLERVIEQINVAHGPALLSVGASAGIVPLSGQTTPDAVMDAADKAMYARKKERMA
jgi:PleD family two-component response regulator